MAALLAVIATLGTTPIIAQENACCRHYVEGHADADDFWSWNTLEGAAISQWRRKAAEKCGGFWSHWKWEKAANKSLERSDPPGEKTRRVTARGNPCK
ncbi:MAG TPA: hypothetical protein VMW68_00580 [Methyloceanibacter sp.]|nr:hypothetical protein [Methyloceanibacter sp.]